MQILPQYDDVFPFDEWKLGFALDNFAQRQREKKRFTQSIGRCVQPNVRERKLRVTLEAFMSFFWNTRVSCLEYIRIKWMHVKKCSKLWLHIPRWQGNGAKRKIYEIFRSFFLREASISFPQNNWISYWFVWGDEAVLKIQYSNFEN